MRASGVLRLALAAAPALACGGPATALPLPARVAAAAPAAPVEPLPAPTPRRPPGAPKPPLIGEYSAVWEPALGAVRVEARLTAAAGALLTFEPGAEPFAHDVEASADRDDAPWSAVTRRGPQFEASACGAGPCRVRYRFALRDAARKLDDPDAATEEGEVIEAPPSTWLLAPARAGAGIRDQRLRFRVTTPVGSRFVTGVFRSAEVAEAWDSTLDDLSTSPYSAFGPLRVRPVPVRGGAIELAIGPGKTAVTEDAIAQWVDSAARSIEAYFGRFPMPGALVLIAVARGRWVGSGRTLSGGGGTVFVRVGERAPAQAFRDDWVLVHEMIHLSFPSVGRAQDWAEEGLATYVEPFARVRAGLLSDEEAWAGLVNGLPNGLPGPGDRGLDHTPTWGRIYWGGALFWFLADVEIRKRTNNRMGLEHALRGIIDAGGTNDTRWPLEEAMSVGDSATGVPVLRELYAAMGASPHPVDLAALLGALGVEVSGGRIHFDDKAPLAAVRRAITHGTETK